MVTHVMFGRHESWTGRIGRFRTPRTAVALPWHVFFRSSTRLDAVAAEPRGPAMQQRALRHRF
jgi:hypothetical protein